MARQRLPKACQAFLEIKSALIAENRLPEALRFQVTHQKACNNIYCASMAQLIFLAGESNNEEVNNGSELLSAVV